MKGRGTGRKSLIKMEVLRRKGKGKTLGGSTNMGLNLHIIPAWGGKHERTSEEMAPGKKGKKEK